VDKIHTLIQSAFARNTEQLSKLETHASSLQRTFIHDKEELEKRCIVLEESLSEATGELLEVRSSKQILGLTQDENMKEIQSLKEKLSQNNEKLEILQTEVDRERNNAKSKEIDVLNLSDSLKEALLNQDRLQSLVQTHLEQYEEATEKIKERESQLNQLNEKLSQLLQTQDKLKETIKAQAHQYEIEAQKNSQKEKEILELKKTSPQVQVLESSLENTRAKLKIAENIIQTKDKEILCLSDALQESQVEIETLRDQLQQKTKELEEEEQSFKVYRTKYEARLENARSDLMEYRNDFLSLKRDYQELQKTHQAMLLEVEKLKEQENSLKNLVQQQEQKLNEANETNSASVHNRIHSLEKHVTEYKLRVEKLNERLLNQEIDIATLRASQSVVDTISNSNGKFQRQRMNSEQQTPETQTNSSPIDHSQDAKYKQEICRLENTVWNANQEKEALKLKLSAIQKSLEKQESLEQVCMVTLSDLSSNSLLKNDKLDTKMAPISETLQDRDFEKTTSEQRNTATTHNQDKENNVGFGFKVDSSELQKQLDELEGRNRELHLVNRRLQSEANQFRQSYKHLQEEVMLVKEQLLQTSTFMGEQTLLYLKEISAFEQKLRPLVLECTISKAKAHQLEMELQETRYTYQNNTAVESQKRTIATLEAQVSTLNDKLLWSKREAQEKQQEYSDKLDIVNRNISEEINALSTLIQSISSFPYFKNASPDDLNVETFSSYFITCCDNYEKALLKGISSVSQERSLKYGLSNQVFRIVEYVSREIKELGTRTMTVVVDHVMSQLSELFNELDTNHRVLCTLTESIQRAHGKITKNPMFRDTLALYVPEHFSRIQTSRQSMQFGKDLAKRFRETLLSTQHNVDRIMESIVKEFGAKMDDISTLASTNKSLVSANESLQGNNEILKQQLVEKQTSLKLLIECIPLILKDVYLTGKTAIRPSTLAPGSEDYDTLELWISGIREQARRMGEELYKKAETSEDYAAELERQIESNKMQAEAELGHVKHELSLQFETKLKTSLEASEHQIQLLLERSKQRQTSSFESTEQLIQLVFGELDRIAQEPVADERQVSRWLTQWTQMWQNLERNLASNNYQTKLQNMQLINKTIRSQAELSERLSNTLEKTRKLYERNNHHVYGVIATLIGDNDDESKIAIDTAEAFPTIEMKLRQKFEHLKQCVVLADKRLVENTESAEKRHQHLQGKLHSTIDELDKCRLECASLRNQINDLSTQIKTERKRYEELQQERENGEQFMKAKNTALKVEMEKVEVQVNELKNENMNAFLQLRQLECSLCEEKGHVQSIKKKLTEKDNEARLLVAKVDLANTKFHDAESRIRQLEDLLSQRDKAEKQLCSQVENLERGKEELIMLNRQLEQRLLGKDMLVQDLKNDNSLLLKQVEASKPCDQGHSFNHRLDEVFNELKCEFRIMQAKYQDQHNQMKMFAEEVFNLKVKRSPHSSSQPTHSTQDSIGAIVETVRQLLTLKGNQTQDPQANDSHLHSERQKYTELLHKNHQLKLAHTELQQQLHLVEQQLQGQMRSHAAHCENEEHESAILRDKLHKQRLKFRQERSNWEQKLQKTEIKYQRLRERVEDQVGKLCGERIVLDDQLRALLTEPRNNKKPRVNKKDLKKV
jgi:hypothetical protein